MNFGWIPSPVPAPLWRKCEPLLQRALDRANDDTDIADIAVDIEANTAQLWVARDGEDVAAVVVTQRDGDVLHIWLMAGEMRAVPFVLLIEKVAQADGCRAVELEGRFGWQRVLRRYGWQLVNRNGDVARLRKGVA